MKTIRNLILATLAVLLLVPCVQAQDLPRFKKMVKQLSSAKYQGRGYARDGVPAQSDGQGDDDGNERDNFLKGAHQRAHGHEEKDGTAISR